MNLLFVNNEISYGGAEKLINDLLPMFKEDGINCELLILTRQGEKYINSLEKNGITVTAIPETNNHFKRMYFINKYIKKHNVDVIHANLFPTIYYISILKRLNGTNFPQIVMTEHSTDNRRRHIKLLRPVERLIYSKYEKVISISKQTEVNLLSWLKRKRNKNFIVVNNGISLTQFKNADSYDRRSLFSGIQENDILLCMVGRFNFQKNHTLMLDILEKLPSKYKLVLVGEGTLLETIKDLVINKRLVERVKFLGFRSDIPFIMKSSDIIVIPSKWEGFGLVAAEAMACGKPVVASNVPGLAEVVDKGLYGGSK